MEFFMKRFAALSSVATLGLMAQSSVYAYEATAEVTFTFGGSNNNASADQGFVSSGGPIAVAGVDENSTLFHTLSGANSTSYYNSDFAGVTANCTIGGGVVPDTATTTTTRKYGCRYTSTLGASLATNTTSPSVAFPVSDGGPVGMASGTLTVTDSTLTGTLTLIGTNDEPSGGTTIVSTIGGVTTRLGTGTGAGFSGFNYRTGDGSPFGNAWYGVTTSMTLTVNLTGTFTATDWDIDGGAVTFNDPNFACMQGGFGGDARGTLCSASTTGGGFQPTGGHISWGMDTDGNDTGSVSAAGIDVREPGGASLLTTLSGVIASLNVDGSGNITTDGLAEFRRASGSSPACKTHIQYDTGTGKIACGSLSAGKLVITGAVADTGPEPIVGTSGDDTLNGTAGDDIIQGLAGNDTINGLGGNDRMEGGPGNDIMFVNTSGDQVIEVSGQGTDVIRSSATYTLPAQVENLTLLGTGNLNATGNGLANTLTGNPGNNRLDGKAGADTLKGLAGNDTYIVDNAGDVVIETANQGVDSVETTVSHVLAKNVERLTLKGGSANINGTGNNLKNIIVGNTGNNTINGWLNKDTLTGGSGQDRFLFNSALSSANVDAITDFSLTDDQIRLENSVFIGLSPGTLPAAAFRIGNQATTPAHRIIYVSGTGALFFDRDGSGSTYNQVRFATLDSGLALTNTRFVVQ
jgi:Ca2+-binding RTX toxin-like protein